MSVSPAFHVTAPSNWLNDPNGPLLWQGRYHLFFQHNPDAPVWGRPHWGHVSSADLVSWQRHPTALTPSDDGPDRDGCWSGCARVINGTPTVLYTGVVGHGDEDRVESVLRATSSGDLNVWRKDPDPVLDGPPPGADTGVHRDPFTVALDGRDHLLVGSSIRGPAGPTGAVLSYVRRDGSTWTYDGVLFEGSGCDEETGTLWECPQFVRLPDGDVLIVSVHDGAREDPMLHVLAFVGHVSNGRFAARSVQRLDGGDVFYAPAVLSLAHRHLLWGWLRDPEPDVNVADPRVGALSVPRELRFAGDHVVTPPAPELRSLRTASQAKESIHLRASALVDVAALPRHAELTCRLTGPGDVVLDAGRTWSGAPARVSVTTPSQRRTVPGGGASPAAATPGTLLQVFVDGDLLEVFPPAAPPTTLRLAGPDPLRLRARSQGGEAALTDVVVHRLTGIW